MAARTRITGDELPRRAASLADWQLVDEHHLARTFRFPDFATALAFVNRVGEAAERLGHHPDIRLTWGRVDVETWTHDAGGITEYDFTLAAAIDRIAAGG